MNRKISRKIPQWSVKGCSIALTAVYVLSLVPLLAIGYYNYPSADDFAMGVGAYRAFHSLTGGAAGVTAAGDYGLAGAAGGFFAALWQGIYMADYDWLNWMGYFTSTAFMSVPPSIFTETAYRAGVWIILGALTFGVLYFMNALLHKALRVDRWIVNALAMIALIIIVQGMPAGLARVEAFYWYCSGANYYLTFSLGLIYLGLLISYLNDEGTGKRRYDLIMACITGFLAGGGNYMTSLTCTIVVVLWGLVSWLLRSDKGRKFLLSLRFAGGDDRTGNSMTQSFAQTESRNPERPQEKQLSMTFGKAFPIIPALFLIAGFALSCAAPGNSVRSGILTGFGPVKAIAVSLLYTFLYPVNDWTRWSTFAVLLLAVPFLWKAVRETALTFSYPVVMSVLAFGLTAANITPCMYAEGNIGAGRLQALFWTQYVILVLLLEGYILGWILRVLTGRGSAVTCHAVSGKSFGKPGSTPQGVPAYSPSYSDSAVSVLENGASESAEKKPETRKAALNDNKDRTGSFSPRAVVYLCFITFVLAFGSALCVYSNPDYYTGSCAVEDLVNGHAQRYAQQNAERRKILQAPAVTDARLDEFEYKPELLFYSDIAEDPEDWQNRAVARYYGKDSVVLVRRQYGD